MEEIKERKWEGIKHLNEIIRILLLDYVLEFPEYSFFLLLQLTPLHISFEGLLKYTAHVRDNVAA